MKILSIDPGYERLGIAILEKNLGDKKETHIYSECFKTSSKLPHHERLALIGKEITRVIEEYKPQALSIETLYFSTNTSTALLVSEARGVILYAASIAGLAVHEFNPMEIKVAVTGYGKSDKKDIVKMVPMLIKLNKEIKHDDEYDAIAAGLTFFATKKFG
jgi:crossover junction endodeoxyribonuclease RuvC